MLARNHTHYAALIAITMAWVLFGLITRIPLIHKAIRIFFPWRAHVAIEYNKGYGCLDKSGWTIIIGGVIVCQLERYLSWALFKSMCKYLRWTREKKVGA
jgi:hypothetical protein